MSRNPQPLRGLDGLRHRARTLPALLAAAAGLALGMAAAPAAAVDVGVSISVAQPGVYGRIDIGRFPQPVLVSPQPVIIGRPVVVAPVQPVAMWVPPGHRKNWGKHCSRYNACGVPVVFVDDGWYERNVARGTGRSDDGHPGHGKGHGKGHDKHKGRDD